MKDWNEMARDVLRRRDMYRKAKAKRIRMAAVGTAMAALICCTAVFAFVSTHRHITPPDNSIDTDGSVPVQEQKEAFVKFFVNTVDEKSMGALKADTDIQVLPVTDTQNIHEFELLKKAVTEELTEIDLYAVYVRSDRDTAVYDRLYEYKCCFLSPSAEKELCIAFSSQGKPIRDCLFDDKGAKVSCINGVEMTVYQYQDILYTDFSVGQTFFDFEARGLSQEDFIRSIAETIRQFQ